MASIGLRIAQRRVSLTAFGPVLAAGIRVLAKVAEGRRCIPLPDASGSPVVRNARFGADACAGERTDDARWPRDFDERCDRRIVVPGWSRLRAFRQLMHPFCRMGRSCHAVTVSL